MLYTDFSLAFIMPSYSAAELQTFINDLGAILQKAVMDNNLKEVFTVEKSRIVSV